MTDASSDDYSDNGESGSKEEEGQEEKHRILEDKQGEDRRVFLMCRCQCWCPSPL